ncbi:UNVERIFIED_CONTAM: hypothetical protein Sradi_4382600 [Sesamum radiatum]|uniref:Uncharacterized protein n=1 Tax=Sesamum radiatum TaxID=300843 RepID=A0AAW2NQJ9_SESRA
MTNYMHQLTLKHLQDQEYTFPDSNVPYIFNELLEKKLIELLELKRLNEARRVNNPKYYKYHRVVSYPIERCFTTKEKIIALDKEGKIILDIEEMRPKAMPSENNKMLSRATNDEALTRGKYKVKKPPYSISF